MRRVCSSVDEAVMFEKGTEGAHVIHNPTETPCKLVAIGWPPEGRYPVHQIEETEELLARRSSE